MADGNNDTPRPRAGTRTWPVDRARRAWTAAWLQAEFAIPARIREWAAIEVGTGRLLPWFAVAFGAGIVLYFTAEHEPAVRAIRPIAFRSPVLLSCARKARRPTALFCASIASKARASAISRSACGCRSSAAPRRRPAHSSRSRRSGSRRWSHCGRAVMISPAIFFFQPLDASGFVHGAIKIVAPPVAAGLRLRGAFPPRHHAQRRAMRHRALRIWRRASKNQYRRNKPTSLP